MELIYAIALITPATYMLGYVTGIYIERKDWNKLIEDGKIPKPPKQ